MHYGLALILEHRDGREPVVRAMAGFGDRIHEAASNCATLGISNGRSAGRAS
jgi:hypothetical protein